MQAMGYYSARATDAVLCPWTLCTIPDPVAAIRQVRRVLRPGGGLAITRLDTYESKGGPKPYLSMSEGTAIAP
jgi:ubiquinone/menaquinone biosynthesis C-methylase UbiE